MSQIPEIRDNILRKVTGGDGEDDPAKWEALSASIMATVFSDDKKARERDLAKLTSTYNLDQLEEVMVETHKSTPPPPPSSSLLCIRVNTTPRTRP